MDPGLQSEIYIYASWSPAKKQTKKWKGQKKMNRQTFPKILTSEEKATTPIDALDQTLTEQEEWML